MSEWAESRSLTAGPGPSKAGLPPGVNAFEKRVLKKGPHDDAPQTPKNRLDGRTAGDLSRALRGWMLERDLAPEELEELLGYGCKFIILGGDADGTDRTQSELKSNLNEPYL